jgi:hypothetical protein
MTLQPHSLRLEVAAVQQQFHLLRASPLWVCSDKRLRAPTRAQLQWNEQALLVEHLCKFYPSCDMFGIHYCYTRLLYSQSGTPPMFSDLVFKNWSREAKPC